MDDLTAFLAAFLAARLDEDEDAARGVTAGPWHVSAAAEKGYPQSVLNNANILVAQTFTGPEVPPMEADYIARHDPARVLREVGADRRLLAEWKKAETDPAVDDQWNAGFAAGLRLAVQIRAARHGGHPDYRPTWKP